jgi:hypothetical protein
MAEKKKHIVKNPQDSIEGKISSNSDGVAISKNFDYGNITQEHKKAVEEVIKFFENNKQKSLEENVLEIKHRFKIIDIPMMKYEDSLWYKFTKNERLGNSIQGFRITTDKNGKKIKIPNIAFSSDLDYLDNMIQRLIDMMEGTIKK